MNPVILVRWYYLGWQGCENMKVIKILKDGTPNLGGFYRPESWGRVGLTMTPAYIKFSTYTKCSPVELDAIRRVNCEMLAIFGLSARCRRYL